MAIKRSVIVDTKILQRLQTIKIAAGYHTDAGNHTTVWRPRNEVFTSDKLPALNIRDVSEDLGGVDRLSGPLNVWDRTLTVEIDVAASTITQYRDAVADVYKAFNTPADTFDSNVITTFPQGDRTEVTEDEYKFLGGTITINLLYRTSRYQEE